VTASPAAGSPPARAVRAEAAAPVRLDLAGGWTDVPPFSAREGGLVVSAAIELYAHAAIEPGGDAIHLVSNDLGERLDLPAAAALAVGDRLPLHRAALRMLPVGLGTLTTKCDAPAGSGLGSSGALDVALVAALGRSRGETRDPIATAELACRLEAVEAGIPGGKQDQYSAALGGFNRLAFHDPDVAVERLALEPAFLDALERSTLLCYTGASRFSGGTIARVMHAYERGDERVTNALLSILEAAYAMVEALRAGDLARVGEVLRRNWAAQMALDPGMCTPEMASLARAMDLAGALGGKAAGSGAGGSMFFVVADPARAREAARAAGVTLLPLRWATEGVRAW
jgi:D-glycero-alpha-D-manno-heptose-7-phosphate kinase